MNIKAVCKYELKDHKIPIIIFYCVIVGLLIMLYISTVTLMRANTISGGQFSGMEMSTAIFLFICGLNSFKGTFRFTVQNGISRKTLFISHLITTWTLAVVMAILDKIVLFIVNVIGNTNENIVYKGILELFYERRYLGNSSDLAMHLDGFLFAICMYAAVLMLGYFITNFYYKMNKGVKIGVSVGVPVGLFIVLPIVEETFTKGKIIAFLIKFLSFAFGFDNGFNPYYAIVTFIIIFAVFSVLSWILMSKSVVKD